MSNKGKRTQGPGSLSNDQTVEIHSKDLAGDWTLASGNTVPSAASGYSVGGLFVKKNATAGIGGLYQNVGTVDSSDFVKIGNVRMKEVSVSIAQMKACRATPVSLVAAPGAGKVLEFLGALFIYDYAAAYTESADNLEIRYTDGSGAIASTTLETTGLLDATADQLRTWKPIVTDLTPVANAPLVMFNNGDGEFGGTGSPVRLKVFYRVSETGL